MPQVHADLGDLSDQKVSLGQMFSPRAIAWPGSPHASVIEGQTS